MIAKFDTAVGGTKKGSSTLLWFAALAIGGYLVYQYVFKPKKADEQTQ